VAVTKSSYAASVSRRVRLLAIGVTIWWPLAGQSAASFLVRTVAGGYNSGVGESGDGGLALQAQLFDPVSVAVDGFGNVFIADLGNNVIRKVAPTGVITKFAGNGVSGEGGDGGPATAAQLTYPQTIATDNTGRVYISECNGTGNNRVRVVDLTGVITTLASGFSCVMGLTLDNATNVYVSDAGAGMIFKISPSGTVSSLAGAGRARGYGGDGGQATNAQFNVNYGIAFDNRSGILYVADQYNHRVRAIYPTGIIQTVAGTGVPGFSGDGGLGVAAQLKYPTGVAVDAVGNVYIADSGNNRMRILNPSALISTVGGSGLQDQGALPFSQDGGVNPGKGDGGPAVLGSMTPDGTIAVDSHGSVYFTESEIVGNSVRELVPSASTVGCMYSAVPAQQTIATGGGLYSISVIAAMNGCPWLAFSTVDWVNLTSGASGTGSGTVSLSASPNPLSANRSALIPIAGQIVTVSQAGTPCTFTLSVQQISTPAAGISGTVSVIANLPDCAWRATSDVPWLFVISGASGQGNGTVNYSVAQNEVAARSGTLTIAGQTVTISQAAAPGFPDVSIIASAATGTSPFASGQLISIYGTSLGPPAGSGLQLGPGGVVTTSNSGTQVLFDGTAAPILYTGASQVNAVIPCEVAGHTSTQMVVEYMGEQSVAVTVPLGPSAPGVFTADGSGQGQAAALNQDNSFNSPSNPALRGSIVTFYATGVGPTSPCVDGAIYQTNFPTLTLPVIVGVGSFGARILYGGQAPDLVSGVAQFNVVIPSDATTGVVPLTLVVGGIFSPSGVTIAVK
jgi:uncharacterized protein (TIGR03437 family)